MYCTTKTSNFCRR